MMNCWKESPDDRPTFTEICSHLTELLEITDKNYNYVDAIRIELSDSDNEEVMV
jgi:hypothetical protein